MTLFGSYRTSTSNKGGVGQKSPTPNLFMKSGMNADLIGPFGLYADLTYTVYNTISLQISTE